MPMKGVSSFRNQSATLNFSKGGSTSIYVDQNHAASDDKNDGYNWSRPKKTIAGAIAILEPWMEIWIKSGTYAENVVITEENVILHGVVQAGLDRVEIAPLTGVPLDVQVGYFEAEGLALVSTNANALQLTGPGQKIHDTYIEVNSDGSTQCTGVLLDDCDNVDFHHNHLNGKYGLNTIGVRVDGTLSDSVDGNIHDNFFQNFGTVGVAGQGINLNNAQRCVIEKNIFDSCYNGIYCEVNANALHSIFGNQFYANASVDVCDMNTDQQVSGITIINNFYGYSGWYQDNDHDGIAEFPVACYYNYDYAPLSSPHYRGPSFVGRYA